MRYPDDARKAHYELLEKLAAATGDAPDMEKELYLILIMAEGIRQRIATLTTMQDDAPKGSVDMRKGARHGARRKK